MSSSDIQETFKDLIEDPDKRFKKFFEFYCDVKLNNSFSIDIYLRSSKEMLRMADVYLSEKDYLHAFVLYSRYVVLHLEKIKTHQGYAQIDKTELSTINKQLKKNAFPKAEKLRAYIKDLFAFEANNYKQSLLELKKKEGKNVEKDLSNDLDDLKLKYSFENDDNNAKSNNENKHPHVDRSLKPLFDYSSYSSITSKYGLRNVILPSNITEEFLKIANDNTMKNIETCGIIAGQLKQNVFLISHCIIPKQTGTSDTCATDKEHEIFDAIDKLNLITLGWIHTHPSQTAFLSSVDLHTHFSYQIMIPESIAIVVAPKYDDVGIFILTPTFGLQQISDCRMSGFHVHSTNPALFEESDHVKINNDLKINMIDLRNI